MILEKIIAGCGATVIEGNAQLEISSICNDSRKAAADSLFIAVRGFASDGHSYIQTAIEKGASAIIFENKDALPQISEDICTIQVASSRKALALCAANFYDNPSHKLTLVGITGTNGKTTTVTLLYKLFRELGYNCGLLSTIANYVGDKGTEAVNTTSDPITINSLLAQMVDEGCEYCFMEVSSIGVEQERV